MILTLRRSFSCAHFYHQPLWSEEKNRETFGKCFTEYGHGHDYRLEVTFSTSHFHLDDSSIKSFEQVLTKILNPVIEKLDHQHLNFVIPEFMTPKDSTTASQIPTTENLALYVRAQISEQLQIHTKNTKGEITLLQLRLFERPDLWVELH
jgi:6-pyruvoyltetrahydropterin/6-carboxytetrahydropterin synthase